MTENESMSRWFEYVPSDMVGLLEELNIQLLTQIGSDGEDEVSYLKSLYRAADVCLFMAEKLRKKAQKMLGGCPSVIRELANGDGWKGHLEEEEFKRLASLHEQRMKNVGPDLLDIIDEGVSTVV